MASKMKGQANIFGAFLTELTIGLLGWIGTIILSIYIESRYRITSRLKKKRHKIFNSDAGLKLHVTLAGDIDFDGLKDSWKDVFRDEYGTLDIHNESSQSLKMSLGEEFVVDLSKSTNQVIVQTERIDSTMKKLKKDLRVFSESVNTAKDKYVNDNETQLEIENYNATIYLPYMDNYIKSSLPGGEIESYGMEVKHQNYRSSVQITSENIEINSAKLRDLERTLSIYI